MHAAPYVKTPLRFRGPIIALWVGVLAVGSVAVAGANSPGDEGQQPGSEVVSVPAAPPINATPLPGDQPAAATGEKISSPAITPLASGEGCADGQACMWRHNGYEGEKRFAYAFEADDGWRRW